MPTDQISPMQSGAWIQAALADIGMATIRTGAGNRILTLCPIAEQLTEWTQSEAVGEHLGVVFRIETEATRQPAPDPVAQVLAGGAAEGMSDHTVLISRSGRECRIDHGASAVRNAIGGVDGAVLFFCDVSERQRLVQGVEDARAFAEGIVQTVREPLVILDGELRVKSANRSFYKAFHVAPPETEGQFFFELGNGQWDIPALRELLEEILLKNSLFEDFEVDHAFEELGRRSMVLNARRLHPVGQRPSLILLSIEDATDRLRAAEVMELSETRYRRLFETAQDGILLVDPTTRCIYDANPFLTDMLGYSRKELVGRELWEIGLFRDIESNKAAFRTLRETGYIRYDDLPLRTHDGRVIEVEFVSNVYDVGDAPVIQCNIRDVTDRKRAEDALKKLNDGLELRVGERTAELACSNATLKNEIARREVAEADRRDLQQRLTTVQENERRRIARELHDQLGQHLTAVALGLKVVKDACPDPSPQRDRLQSLQTLTDQIGREVHHLALELRPTALDDLGIQAATANYTEGWSERSGVEVDFQCSGLLTDRLPSPVETALYRVTQEALTNVLKHASAHRVSVVIQRLDGQVSVVIEDDGRGFDAEATLGHRLGVLGMRERAALVGGTLTIESAPGRGTTVIARVPLPATEIGEP